MKDKIKVLWFSINSSLYTSLDGEKAGHGGWIGSLENIIREHNDIQLAIAFEHKDGCFKSNQDGVTYYPMQTICSKKDALLRHYNVKEEEKQVIPACLKVIEDYKPDVIHIFGSEWCFGLLKQYTKIPIVIHIQGSIPPYQNSSLPPGISYSSIFKSYGLHFKKKIGYYVSCRNQKIRKQREEKILSLVDNFMGRTEWDYNLVKLFNPTANYFFCNEALNPVFVNSKFHWQPKQRDSLILLTVGAHFLKGIDVVYKTAELLKTYRVKAFEWHIIGEPYHDSKVVENMLGVSAERLNIKYLGYMTSEEIKKELLECDFYIHPAYAENSPNSICEAQMMGVPVIASYCGGIPSLVSHRESGFLYPVNDPYSLCSAIIQLKNDQQLQERISIKSKQVASNRHAPQSIYDNLLDIYKQLIKK
ncbi:glycosyltransferase family 4 protein [Segatella copri]|uniref:glycosyltransferase family 4 protein n=1 Tax=Segatella copri TaxID=165179 RepID=UPI003F8A6BB5